MAGNLVGSPPTGWTADWDQLSGSPGGWTLSGGTLTHAGADTSGCASDAFAVTPGELLYVAATGSGSITAGARFRVAFGGSSSFASGAVTSYSDIVTGQDFAASGQVYDGFVTVPAAVTHARLVVYNLAAGACVWSSVKARRLSDLTAPTVKVEVAFGRASNYANNGILTWKVGAANSDNRVGSSFLCPRAGGTLDVTEWSDVSAACQSASITRGRRTRTDEYETGQCTLVLDNSQRDFDPLNTNASADWVINGVSYVGTGRPVRVSLVDGDTGDEYRLFTGRATSWVPAWDGGGDASWVTIQAAEYLLELNKPIAETTFASARTDVLLGAMLDALDWPAALRRIDTGTVTAPEITVSGSILGYLRLCATTELGRLYLAGDGSVRFRIGSTWRTANVQATFDPASTVGAFGLDYERAAIAYDLDLLRNRVAGTRYGVGAAGSVVSDNADSIASYGTHGYEVTDLLFQTGAEVRTWTEAVLAANASPVARVSEVEVWPLVNSAWWGLLQWADFGDRYTVKVAPPPQGSDVITQTVQLESLRWDIRPNVEGGVRVVLGLVPAGT